VKQKTGPKQPAPEPLTLSGHPPDDSGCQRIASSAWFLYLIECRDGSLYTGIAKDVAARYAAHCSGKGARYTRSHPPARLLGRALFPDHSSALRAEHAVKRLTPEQKRRFFQAIAGDMPVQEQIFGAR
jgi:putative endonuclease